MKMFLFLGLMLGANFASAQALPHLDLEMSSSEYRAYLQKNAKFMRAADAPSIANALKLGERLSKWIETENKNRPAAQAIRLTSSGTRRGIPIDKPSIYSEVTVEKDMATLMTEMPAEMKEVILSTAAYPTKLPVADEVFITFGRRLDRIYQTAARFKSLNPYRSAYEANAAKDVRGYYHLVTNKIDETKLADVTVFVEADAIKVQDALIGICMNNSVSVKNCKDMVVKAWKENKAAPLYTKYFPKAAKIWKAFFDIPGYAVRDDVDYRDENVMNVPFNTPTIAKFKPYLKDNIEAEFKYKTWGLKIIFGDYANGPRLDFQSGVVPHVNGLGGNQIVMDANQPIEEYESQWTIRHEFGHVIGLPDCYHEFYDVNLKAYVNYQLDITDIMCSRAGDMNERIYKELKRAYFH